MPMIVASVARQHRTGSPKSSPGSTRSLKAPAARPAPPAVKTSPTCHASGETSEPHSSPSGSKDHALFGNIVKSPGGFLIDVLHLSGAESTTGPAKKELTKGEIFVQSGGFQFFVLTFVLLNSLQLGFSVQWPNEPWTSVWTALEHVFTAVFAIEMIIKLVCLKWSYFHEMWNIADFFLAWLSILDNWVLTPTVGSERMSQFTACRMLRVVRVCRMIKVLRVKRELLVLVEGMIASLKGMFWVSMLLFLFVYAGAIVFNMLIVQEETEFPSTFKAEYYFGDLWSAMITLFGIIIGAEWTKYIEPLSDANRKGVVMCFICFFFIGAFGFLNIIIGVIVDNTNEAANNKTKEDLEAHKQNQMEKVSGLVSCLNDYDYNEDGTLDCGDFKNIISEDPNFRSILMDLNMPLGFSISDLQVMLDENMDGQIKHKEFQQGLQRLIYCNEFQHICLAKLERARILQCVKEVSDKFDSYKQEISKNIGSAIDKAVHELREEIRALHTGAPPPPSKPFALPSDQEYYTSEDPSATATDQVTQVTQEFVASEVPSPPPYSEAARDAFQAPLPESLPPGNNFVALSIEPLPAAEDILKFPGRLTAEVAYDDKGYPGLRPDVAANPLSNHSSQAEWDAPLDAKYAERKLTPPFDFQSPYQGVEGLTSHTLRSSGRVDAGQDGKDDAGYPKALPDLLPDKGLLRAVAEPTVADQPIVTYWC